MTDLLEERRKADQRDESARELLLLDILAERFGQAEWQRLRHDDPIAFFTAKIRVGSGPPHLEARFEKDYAAFSESFRLVLSWYNGTEPSRWHGTIEARQLYAEEHADEFLQQVVLNSVARDIQRDSGHVTRFAVRENREALAFSKEPAAPLEREPEVLFGMGRMFCDICKADAELSVPLIGAPLACGHDVRFLSIERVRL